MDMYPAIINSPETTLSQDITDLSSEIVVEDGNKLPPAPNLATIGYDTAEAETVLYGTKVGNTLTEVVRGFQGQARPWNSGAVISRMFTAYDHDAFLQSIRAVENDVDSIEDFIDELQIPTSARIIVGTSASGWEEEQCHYLCDGIDDQAEIIAALAALPSAGGEIVILDGTYNITASINIPKDNVSLRGNGNATILKRMYNSTNTDSGPTARGLITLNEKSGCKIQGLQIDGNKATYTASDNYGIYLSSSSNNTVTGNTCNNNFYGIYLSSSSNNTVTGNTCNNNSSGIRLSSSSSDNTVTGNTCNNNSSYGIYLSSSSNNTVTGNTCNNNSSGIRLSSSSSDNTVTGNTCNNNSSYGIHLSSSSDNTVTSNTCNNNSSSGIFLSLSSSDNTVTSNTCIRGIGTPEDYTTYQYTIFLSGTSNNYNLISSNNCMGKAPVVEGGTGNTVFNNKWDESSDFEEHLKDGTQHAKTARFVVGTSTSGWTAKDCHYLCDGTADDVEIIQALNALPATGGEIVILDGTYNITATINIPKDNVSIRGSGNATTLKRMYNSTYVDSGPTAKGLIILNEKSGCKIQGLQIDGNKATYTASYNYGICLHSSSNNTITGNTCNNNSYGIYLFSSSNNTVTDNTCNNNSYGISLSSSSNNTLTGNTYNNNSNYGIYLYSSSDNTVTGNTCNNNNNCGIYLHSSSDNTVTGNTCNNNGNGIRLHSSSNNTVTGNTCNNSNYGIYLYSSSNNNTVTGNTCIRGTGTPEDYTTDQHTILLSGTSNNYNLISSNNCMGKAVVISGGTGNSAWGNKYDSGDDLPI
jgi:parallel beta-helix repeat protein